MEHIDMKSPIRQLINKKNKADRTGISHDMKKELVSSLSERFSALGYTSNDAKVIQPKLVYTYDKFASTQKSGGEVQILRRYVEYMMKPEIEMLRWIGHTWHIGGREDAQQIYSKARRLERQLNVLPNSPSRPRQVSVLSREIIDLEERVDKLFPDEYKEKESELIYKKSEATQDDVRSQTEMIFSRLPPNQRPSQDQLNGGEYLQSIAELTFTEFRNRFRDMPGLLYIMNQIYVSWYWKEVVDRRTERDKDARASTPDEVGAIRCIHTDTNPGNRIPGDQSYQLPRRINVSSRLPESVRPKLPEHAKQYHDHVTQKAIYGADKKMQPLEIDANVRKTGKFLVEYSGILLGGERKPHNNKLVFNYLTGDMYVTFNHYRVMMKVDMTS